MGRWLWKDGLGREVGEGAALRVMWKWWGEQRCSLNGGKAEERKYVLMIVMDMVPLPLRGASRMDRKRVKEKAMLMTPRPKVQYTPTRTAPLMLRMCRKVKGRMKTGRYCQSPNIADDARSRNEDSLIRSPKMFSAHAVLKTVPGS